MKERPIIFSAPMVRAILSGAKTQTRRVVKRYSADCIGWFDDGDGLWAQRFIDPSSGSPYLKSWRDRCPYGQPGGRLWVRETWGAWPHAMGGVQRETLRYRADGEYQNEHGAWRWRSPVSMPRWASRITLEITGVRVEALLDISVADAVAEGVRCGDDRWHRNENGEAVFMDAHGWYTPEGYMRHSSPKHAFRTAWEEINGNGSWEKDPWVWVIEFKKLEQKEQA